MSDGDVQAEVFAWLADPATHGGNRVQRYETHAAMVFLAGDRALKVKRAVRYPFLDFSTLAKREAACRAELAINRKFAPQLYRGVVPITRQRDGTLALNGAGETIEWAVEMARFDESKTLDHLVARGGFDDALAKKLAVAVAAMHARAEPADAKAWIDALDGYVLSNAEIFARHRGLFPPEDIDALERQSLTTLARLRPLLEARGRSSLVRRGHGDLHLGNIAVLDGEPVAFDALEFDAVIASGDVLYDLAFLLMDLVEADHRRAANLVLNGYFAAVRRDADYDGIAAMPFFMSLRAAIRAMATVSRRDVSDSKVAQTAKRYFDLALELLAPAIPALVCTGGLSGTGKSVLARDLAPLLLPAPGALILRSDVERKELYGVAWDQRLPADAYSAKIGEQIYGALAANAARIAAAGHSVVVDAVFAKPQERTEIEAAARAAKAAFHGLFLIADLPTRIARVDTRSHDASDADGAVARQQERFDRGAMRWTEIDASGSVEETLAAARAACHLD